MTNPNPGASAWPANYQGVQFVATYLDSKGLPIAGTVTFTPTPVRVLDYALPLIIIPKAVAVTLDGTGSLSVLLPATDDPDVSPVGWTYHITENFIGGMSFDVEGPQNTVVNLCTVSPVPAANGVPIVRGPRGIDGSVITVQGQAGDGAGNVNIAPVVLLKANNLSDLVSASQARTNLGLGDAATHPASDFATPGSTLQRANNLADLNNVPLARSNLGLGDLATQNGAAFISGSLGTMATASRAGFVGVVANSTQYPTSTAVDGQMVYDRQLDVLVVYSSSSGTWVPRGPSAMQVQRTQNFTLPSNQSSLPTTWDLGTTFSRSSGITFSGGYFTVRDAGLYRFDISCDWPAMTAANYRYTQFVWVGVNGLPPTGESAQHEGRLEVRPNLAGGVFPISSGGPIVLPANGTIQPMFYQTTGSNIVIVPRTFTLTEL